MNTPKFTPLLLCIAVAITLFSCTKQGPAGPMGQAGFQGQPGVQGPAGPQGDTGTANVIYSSWNNSFSGNNGIWAIPELTQNIIDSGLVLVYAKELSTVIALPYSIPQSSYYVVDLISVGQIQLSSSTNLDDFSFSYIIIPGGVPSVNSLHPPDYNSICIHYHIPSDN
jgi:hypothetical protein